MSILFSLLVVSILPLNLAPLLHLQVSLSFEDTVYEPIEAAPAPPRRQSAPSNGFQILRMPMRPRFVTPDNRLRARPPMLSPFGAAPFGPVMSPRGPFRPMRRVGELSGLVDVKMKDQF